MNREEKARWRYRSDATLTALRRAHRAVLDLEKLEIKADRLGVERIYTADHLASLKKDLRLKAEFVSGQRNRKFR